MTDPIEVLTRSFLTKLHETTERMLTDDLRLLGVDPEAMLGSGAFSTRLIIAHQRVSPDVRQVAEHYEFTPSVLYRGLMLDGRLVIDHLWNYPIEHEPGGFHFVFFGDDRERMSFAREHTLDQRAVLHWPHWMHTDRLRGHRAWLHPIITGSPSWLERNGGWRMDEALALIDHLNDQNGYRRLDRYGN